MQKPQNHSARARDFGLRITILARMLVFHIIQYVRHVECRLTIFFPPVKNFRFSLWISFLMSLVLISFDAMDDITAWMDSILFDNEIPLLTNS